MNRALDWLGQARRDLKKAELVEKAQGALEAARAIIQFCEDHIAGSSRPTG